MFYLLSKLFWLLLQPTVACQLMIAAGLAGWPRFRPWGRRLAITGLALLALLSVSPLGNILIYPLEQRFAGVAKPEATASFAGIIMLGGFEDATVSRQRHALTVSDSAERLFEGLLLARRLPSAKVIFTGGSADPAELGGSQAVGQYLLDSGVTPDRIVLESKSRSTYENALLLKAILQPKPGDRYVLVTSAFHMPRSVGVFRAVGFDVLPDPVDYRTAGIESLWAPYTFPVDGLRNAEYAIKEWVGLLAYRLSGRTKELWPGP